MSMKGGPVFQFSLPGESARPLTPCQLRCWLGWAVLTRKRNNETACYYEKTVGCCCYYSIIEAGYRSAM